MGTPRRRAYRGAVSAPGLQIWERNPYYGKVDRAGRQLPYVDRLQLQKTASGEMVAAKTATGQVHFSAYGIQAQDIPLFKMGERTGRYRTFIWNALFGSDVVIQPNLTCRDPRLRALFRDLRFRQALSLAIDRDEINAIVYFGQGTPRQLTVVPTSRFFEPAYERAYADYRPDEAVRLLDAMRLKDLNGDGFREYPDGGTVNPTLEFYNFETPKGVVLELVAGYWRKIGIRLNLKEVSASLQSSRAGGNLMEMTVWHADRCTDILFPIQPYWFVPMHAGWEECHWGEWANWHLSDGMRGETPPPGIRALLEHWSSLTSSGDEGQRSLAGHAILQSQAENIWTIGTVGLTPHPVVVHEALHNVPERGYWGWDNRFTMPYHSETWFLEAAAP